MTEQGCRRLLSGAATALLLAHVAAGQSAALSRVAPGRVVIGAPGVADQRDSVSLRRIAEAQARASAQSDACEAAPFMPVPVDLPAPERPATAAADQAPAEPPPSPAPGPLAAAPALATNFLALGDNNTSIPPDTHGAVGPSNLMVTLNSQVRIQDRTGTALSTVTLNSFWASLGSPSAFDPKVMYDPYANRWIFVSCANSRSTNSAVLVAVSQTSDPSGTWNRYRVEADPADLLWADYPSIGFNTNWIVLQVNMFTVSASAFSRSQMYVFDKTNLYAAGSGLYALLSDAAIGGTQVPATTLDPALTNLYMVETWNTNVLRLFTISGAVGAPALTYGPFVFATNSWDSSVPLQADLLPQLGSAQKIQANDSRMQNVIYRNGSLWCVHHFLLPPGGAPTRSAVQWYQLSTAGALLQGGMIDDPAGGKSYGYPSLAVNRDNDMLVGYSRFSSSQYASANYAFRYGSDPAGTLRDDTVFKAGEAPYYKIFSGTRNRWGDYSHTVVDPVNDTDMWTIQEYAATPSGGSDRWGTWWGKLVVPASTATLDVVSTYDVVQPAVGHYVYPGGTNISCVVTGSPVVVADAQRQTTSICTGWTGTGSVPLSGSTTNTGSFQLLNNSTITWNWAVSTLLLSNQTVTGAVQETARDAITAQDGYHVSPSGSVLFQAGMTIRLGPEMNVDSGSLFRATINTNI